MSTNENTVKVALADDHRLLRDALASLIDTFENCKVIFTASDGREVIDNIQNKLIPDVMILDYSMEGLNGYDTSLWLSEHQPSVKIMMLTMYDTDVTLIRLLKAGVKGFLKKDVHPDELKYAIKSVMESGYYYSHTVTGKVVNLFKTTMGDPSGNKLALDAPEIDFLKLCCTDNTYKEIATKLGLSPRNVDAMRDQLFFRLGVKSRVGLAMFAIRHGLMT